MNPSPYSLPMRPQPQVRSTAAMQAASCERVPCECGRKFAKHRLDRHRAICTGKPIQLRGPTVRHGVCGLLGCLNLVSLGAECCYLCSKPADGRVG